MNSIRDSSIQVRPAQGLRARLRRMVHVDDSAVLWLRLWRGLAVLALMFGFASLARAQSCTVTTAELAFGQYDPIGTHASGPSDSSSTIRVGCRPPPGPAEVVFTADLGPGAHASGIQRRLMGPPGEYIAYGVYLDGSRNVPFGSQSGGGVVTCRTGHSTGYCTGGQAGSERFVDFPIYGRIPGGQEPGVGTYHDRLLLTITY